MEITVTVASADAIHGRLTAELDGELIDEPCAIGRGGVRPAADKREGDGATPLGTWPIRRIYYRADRIDRPDTEVPVQPIDDTMGWCDEHNHQAYNQLVTLPFEASHEVMARDDHLYDLVVVLGHNDDPPEPGMGSAIFWHLKRGEDDPGSWKPTAGCVATTLPVLYRLLAACDEHSVMRVVLAD